MGKARGGLGYWSGEGQDGRWRWAVQVAQVEARSAERVRRSCGGDSRVDWKVAGAREGRPRRGTKEE